MTTSLPFDVTTGIANWVYVAGGGSSQVIPQSSENGAWLPAIKGNWLGSATDFPAGQHTYELSFTLSAADQPCASIDAALVTDNGGSFELCDGARTSCTFFSGSASAGVGDFATRTVIDGNFGAFHVGANVLRMHAFNAPGPVPNPAGIYVHGMIHSVCPPPAPPAAPPGCDLPVHDLNVFDGTSATYFFYAGLAASRTWDKARDYCNACHGGLARVLAQADQDLLYRLANARAADAAVGGVQGIWLAGTSLDDAGAYDGTDSGFCVSATDTAVSGGGACIQPSSWYWYSQETTTRANATPLTQESLGSVRGMAPWNNGEPNNCCGGEHCLFIWAVNFLGLWNDYACHTAQAFICEASRPPPPPPTSPPTSPPSLPPSAPPDAPPSAPPDAVLWPLWFLLLLCCCPFLGYLMLFLWSHKHIKHSVYAKQVAPEHSRMEPPAPPAPAPPAPRWKQEEVDSVHEIHFTGRVTFVGNRSKAAADRKQSVDHAEFDQCGARVRSYNLWVLCPLPCHRPLPATIPVAPTTIEPCLCSPDEAKKILMHAAEEYYEDAIANVVKPPLLYVEGHTSAEHKGHGHSVRVSKARAELCAFCIRHRLQELMPERPASVVDAMVVSVGYGAERPLPGFEEGGGPNGYEENRRVELHLRMPRREGAADGVAAEWSKHDVSVVQRRVHKLRKERMEEVAARRRLKVLGDTVVASIEPHHVAAATDAAAAVDDGALEARYSFG